MAKTNSKKIVKVHEWRGTLKKVELECGHLVERQVYEGCPLPKTNKLSCDECNVVSIRANVLSPMKPKNVVEVDDLNKVLNVWRERQNQTSIGIVEDTIGDCIEDIKKLIESKGKAQ